MSKKSGSQAKTATRKESGSVKSIGTKPGHSNVTGSAYNTGGDLAFRGKGTWKK